MEQQYQSAHTILKQVPQIFTNAFGERNFDDLSDDAKKFRSDYEKVQKEIQKAKSLQSQAMESGDALTHSKATQQLDDLNKSLNEMTPPEILTRYDQLQDKRQSDKKLRSEISKFD